MRSSTLLLAVLLGACAATPPLPARQGPDRCLLALHVRTRGLPNAEGGVATSVWFARVGEDGEILSREPLVRSNYARASIVYLANAAPGTYVAVSCARREDGRDQVTHFPREMVEMTRTTVAPGAYAWMGSYLLDRTIAHQADEAQAHYAPRIEPDWRNKNLAVQLFMRKYYRLGRNPLRIEDDARRRERARADGAAAWDASARAQ